MKKKSAVKKALFTPLFKMRVVKAKKGKGSWKRKNKHVKDKE
jgi:stalled ribosome alternative rescue factor ArfA